MAGPSAPSYAFNSQGYDSQDYGAEEQEAPSGWGGGAGGGGVQGAGEQLCYEAGAYYVGGEEQQGGYYAQQQQQQQQYYHQQRQYGSVQGGGWAGEEEDVGQALLAQALVAEQERASKKGKGMDLSGIQFKEVNQKDLTYVDPVRREAAASSRVALGTEYAAKLRTEAKPHEGNQLSKRKHQIGTLFYNAKMKELEILEGKASGMRAKSETQGKYGW